MATSTGSNIRIDNLVGTFRAYSALSLTAVVHQSGACDALLTANKLVLLQSNPIHPCGNIVGTSQIATLALHTCDPEPLRSEHPVKDELKEQQPSSIPFTMLPTSTRPVNILIFRRKLVEDPTFLSGVGRRTRSRHASRTICLVHYAGKLTQESTPNTIACMHRDYEKCRFNERLGIIAIDHINHPEEHLIEGVRSPVAQAVFATCRT